MFCTHREVQKRPYDAPLVVPPQLVQHALEHGGQLPNQVRSHRLQGLVDQVVDLGVVLVLRKV